MLKTAEQHETYVAPTEAQKREAGGILDGIGRLNRDAFPRLDRALTGENFVAIRVQVDRRRFHSAGPWLGFDPGYKATIRDLGTVFMHAEGSIAVDPRTGEWSVRIPVEVIRDEERLAVRRRKEGTELQPHHVPDPLRAARGLERVDPEPVTGIVVDHDAGVIRAEPDVGISVELTEPGASMTSADPEEYFRLIHAVVLRSLGLREIEAVKAS